MNLDSVSRVIGHPAAISALCEQAKFEAALTTHGVSWVWEFVQENNPGRDNPYHNNRHMMQVALRSLELYTLENIQDPDFEHAPTLLFVAAMLHDFGHSAGVTSDEENIEAAVAALHQIGGTLEKQFYYGAVDHVERIIRVTQFPFVYVPELAEERIIRDADAMSSFCIDGPHQIIESLRSEMQAGKEPISRTRMVEMQREFFPQIEYFTETAKKVYELANEAVMAAFEAYADFVENRGEIDGNGNVMPAGRASLGIPRAAKAETVEVFTHKLTEWKGGDQPVADDVRVAVLLRRGDTQNGFGEDFEWKHFGIDLDIVAYTTMPVGGQAESFIRWEGGAQPVPDGTRVMVVYRNENCVPGLAEKFTWEHIDNEGDIIAYRVVGG